MSKCHLLGNLERGLLFIVSAPAGTGKTTLVSMLTKEFPCIKMNISCTTREPRPYEQNGVHYHFLTEDEFTKKIDNGEFLEHVVLFGNRYGTSKKHLDEELNKGHHVVLVIDTQGAMLLKGKVDATFIFLMPPSKEELERRLKGRGTENKEMSEIRLKWAKEEIETAEYYDYLVVNDDLTTAYQVLRSIFVAEEHRTKYLKEVKNS